jgi:hypothetical protein
MLGQYWIDRTGQRRVALQNGLTHAFVPVLLSQSLKLIVQVEHQNRIAHSSRDPEGIGMQAYNEVGFVSKTQRGMQVLSLSRHAFVQLLVPLSILVRKRLQPLPHGLLEFQFVQVHRFLEHNGERAQIVGIFLVTRAPIQKRVVALKIVLANGQSPRIFDVQFAARKSGLCPDTRKVHLFNVMNKSAARVAFC